MSPGAPCAWRMNCSPSRPCGARRQGGHSELDKPTAKGDDGRMTTAEQRTEAGERAGIDTYAFLTNGVNSLTASTHKP